MTDSLLPVSFARSAVAALLLSAPLSSCAGHSSTGPTSSAPGRAVAATSVAAVDSPSVDPLPAWGHSSGDARMNALNSDLNALARVPRDATALQRLCRNLGKDAAGMRAVLPTPDPTLTSVLQGALTHFDESVSSCAAGDYLTTSVEQSLGTTPFHEALAYLRAVAAGTPRPPLAPTSATDAAFEQWGWTRHGFPLIETLHTDTNRLAATSPATATAQQACGQLQRDVASGRAVLPTPDAQLTSLVTSALDKLGAAATTCLAGDFGSSVADERAALPILDQVAARANAVAAS